MSFAVCLSGRCGIFALERLFRILFEGEVFPVEAGVGKMIYPVAENHHAAVAGEHEVEHDVAVPENEKVDMRLRVGGGIGFGVLHERFLVFTHVGNVVVVHAAVCRPAVGESYRPARVYARIEPLAETAVKNRLYQPEGERAAPHVVAVCQVGGAAA